VISSGALFVCRPSACVNSVTTPAGVTRPIAGGAAWSLNQTLPSGPAPIPLGIDMSGVVASVIVPSAVTLPMPGTFPLSVK
jgi:hypothetical protein